jgi:hypothetical protein
MNDENNIISPDDILLEDTREEISPYETEIKKEKLTVDDLTSGLKNYLNPDLEKNQRKIQKDIKTNDALAFWGTGYQFDNFRLSKELAEKEKEKNPNIIKINETKYIDTTTGKNIFMGTGNDGLTEQVASALLETGYSVGQLITLPLDLAF